MMLFTGLALAAVIAGPQTTDPIGAYNLNPPTVAVGGIDVPGPDPQGRRAELARRERPNEVTCEIRPVTGSRFNQRRCRTRNQTAVAQAEAQRFVGDMQPGPSTEAALGGPR